MFDDEFATVLRPHLPGLEADRPIDPQTPLKVLGLDSISSVALLMDLEHHYELEFPDQLLTPAVFASAGTLWAAVAQALGSARRPVPGSA